MIEALEPLAELPGVQLVMLVTHDGVPIAVPGKKAGPSPAELLEATNREEALAALAVGWLKELGAAVAPLSWDEPRRIVLRCARGVLVVSQARSAVLVVLLARGSSAEDVRLAVDGTIARIERTLRGMGRESHSTPSAPSKTHPPGPLPSKNASRLDGGLAETTHHGKTQDSGK